MHDDDKMKDYEDKMGDYDYKYSQVAVNYVPVSPALNEGTMCAGCAFFKGGECLAVEGRIEPTGWCNLYAPLPNMIAEETQIGERSFKLTGIFKRPDGFKQSLDDEQTAFKATGNGQWIGVFSNNFVDRENEIITGGAWDRYIARLKMGFVDMPKLVDMHLYPHTVHGYTEDIVHLGHMVVAVGRFTDDELGRKSETYYRKNKHLKFTMSHGFNYLPAARKQLEDGTVIYDDINTFEISVLPEGLALPVNPYTEFEVKELMNEEQRKYFEDKYGDEWVKKNLDPIIEKGKVVAESGVRFKSFADLTEQPQDADKTAADTTSVGDDMLEVLIEGQAETLKAVDITQKAVDKIIDDYNTQIKTLTDLVKQLQAQVNAVPKRVDESTSNIVIDAKADKETKARSEDTEYDPLFPGQFVPIRKGEQS